MDRLSYVKKGVPIPDKLVWNGVADSGQVVPDGNYTATIEAVDDNGNRGSVGPFPIVVDNTPPAVEITVPEIPPIFGPDGDGSKETILIKLSGSVEDLWTAQVADASGKAVRTLKFENAAPADWTWDGKGDDGKVVPDGVYSFSISSTDRAGNSVSKRFDNIVVNTQQPPIALVIDLASFSPNGDGVKDVVTLFPSVPVKTGIVSWKLSVLDKGKREVWSQSGHGRRLAQGPRALRRPRPGHAQDPARGAVPGPALGHLPQRLQSHGELRPTSSSTSRRPRAASSADRPAFNPAGAQGQNSVHFRREGRQGRQVGRARSLAPTARP